MGRSETPAAAEREVKGLFHPLPNKLGDRREHTLQSGTPLRATIPTDRRGS
jgi:hypothetical protein